MPYIPADKRTILDDSLASLAAKVIVEDSRNQAGVLNYCITALFNEVLKTKGVNYRNINELIEFLSVRNWNCIGVWRVHTKMKRYNPTEMYSNECGLLQEIC